MEFLWTKEIVAPEFPALEGERETEVLVIGGGMAGVLCALKLQEAGVDYHLITSLEEIAWKALKSVAG